MLRRSLPCAARCATLFSAARTQLRFQLRCYASYPAHTVIGMPALSPTMTQGNLANWVKKEGDALAPGDVIAEIETDKAQMDFEFQEDGFLAKILVPDGTKDIPVNKPIGVYVEDANDVPAFKDFKLEDATTTSTAAASPSAEQPAKESENAKEPEKRPVLSSGAAAATGSAPAAGSEGRIIASPLAKTIALEKGVSLRQVTGTGPHGRIVKADVEQFLANKPAGENAPAPTPAQSKAGFAAAASPAPPVAAGGKYKDIEVTQMRGIIADRLLQSTQSIPSYIVSTNVSVSKLSKLRKSLNATSNGNYKLSINDLLIKIITVAAKRVPEANSYWMGNEKVIRQFENVDVSVAVATPSGLLTPIVKNADTKGLTAISREVKELAGRAKINKLKPEEFQGGTICISNMGMNHAVNMFTSIINPPQSTILAVGTLQKIAVEDAAAEHGFTFDEQITITGTFDHRTIDGAKAGEFMRELKRVTENPLELLL
ncbi:dihydrolipoyllysine-residue acetyltransferase KNAG_0M01950 [Huiozyma naganishii CBS 8797]|uniref:Acetyltransferase component of pyruvate dehydrogenase complex n=1 Tax=Huiozyma naganishii (strain ATCC MYA-139 / BCRC 22969 / CBS 8797 / KCTC 17520 / NBRC 10181 / NCYC 3082 / Yp74L-3) TaxID=1071383 RepID=J7RSZ6_HUIN7|nr:hypothetical protein KNAG_0M01950 [Kazachstania naganishii CBS 8797]CCK73048.1 hypothetical protein KNAG_0M01950 [Kazachstania naganishii CBS 8797]